jgi:hypothetical protein
MPSVAGKYFFKIAFLNIATMNDLNAQREQVLRFISVEDWPLILIFGEVNPAVITGIVRYAGYNQTLFNRPIQESGKVLARMTMRLDPYTGKSRPDLPLVDAAGYFSATAQGYYKIQGLAPGLYDLYASAAGYPQTLIASGVTVLRGQSLHFDGYLQPGWVIHGNVFSKGQSGDTPWAENAPVKIELYDGPTLDHIPDRRANRVSWSSSQPIAGALQNARGTVRGPQDVGPPQHWFVQGGTTTTFHYEFGVKGEYGAPRDLDGMVPQVYATWVNGLTPGRHYARAWVSGYNQSADDGSTFLEHYFDVKPDEWAGEVTLTINLRRRGIDST